MSGNPFSTISAFKFLLYFNTGIFFLAALGLVLQGKITFEDQIVLFGALNTYLVELGGVWLLMTANFVHFLDNSLLGSLHFFLNMYVFFQLGQIVENYYGSRKLFITYILGGLAASLATYFYSIIVNDVITSVGASGSIFAILGLIAAGARKNHRFGQGLPIDYSALKPTILMAIVLSFLPGINWMAHLGGLVMGYIIGNYFDVDGYRPDKTYVKVLFNLCVLIFLISYLLLIANIYYRFI